MIDDVPRRLSLLKYAFLIRRKNNRVEKEGSRIALVAESNSLSNQYWNSVGHRWPPRQEQRAGIPFLGLLACLLLADSEPSPKPLWLNLTPVLPFSNKNSKILDSLFMIESKSLHELNLL